jgi:hypothetical protein
VFERLSSPPPKPWGATDLLEWVTLREHLKVLWAKAKKNPKVTCVWVTAAIIVMVCLFPPYDTQQLLVTIFVVVSVAGAVMYTLHHKEKQEEEKASAGDGAKDDGNSPRGEAKPVPSETAEREPPKGDERYMPPEMRGKPPV